MQTDQATKSARWRSIRFDEHRQRQAREGKRAARCFKDSAGFSTSFQDAQAKVVVVTKDKANRGSG